MIKIILSRKYYLIDINTKNILYIYVNIIKFNYIPYKIEKVFVCIYKVYLCVRINLIIYVIVNDILFIQYIYYLIIYKITIT